MVSLSLSDKGFYLLSLLMSCIVVMRYKILSKNTYIKLAFRYVLKKCDFNYKICIVDIDSFYSFGELLDVIEYMDIEQNVFLMKGISVHSKVLAPITAFDRDDGLSEILCCIKNGRSMTWTDIEDYIARVLELSMMTEKEKKIAIAVAQYSNISAVATFLNANNKTVYSRVGVIARKLNLQHVTEVRQFIGIEIA